MLRKRIITALCGIPIIILAVWFSRPEYAFPLFTVMASAWGLAAVYEFYRITGVSKNIPLTVFGLLWTLLFILYPHFDNDSYLPVLITSGIGLSLILLVFLPIKNDVFNRWTWMTTGVLYVGWMLGLLISLRLDTDGRNWVYLILFATFASDSAAYFTGKAFGKHKLAPKISPGKTWEGVLGGLVGATVMSFLFTLETPLQISFSYANAAAIGIIISVFGQLGDLAESLLKRNTGVKDSGTLMPGHGGLLDRMDSIIFAGAAVYVYLTFYIL